MRIPTKEKAFIIFTPFFLFLLSFHLILNLSEKTPAQEAVFFFLEEEKEEHDKGSTLHLFENYTLQEKAHLEDVQSLLGKTEFIFYLLIPLLTLLFLHLRKDKEELLNSCLSIGKWTIGIAAVLRFLTLFFFEPAFAIFHLIFFPQGNWMFPADSLLLHTFPIDFFINFTRNFLFTALILGSIFILLPIFWKYLKKKGRVGGRP